METTQRGSNQPVDTLPINYFRSTDFRDAENMSMYPVGQTTTALDGETGTQMKGAQEETYRAPKHLDQDEDRKDNWKLAQANQAIEIRIEHSTATA